MSDVIVGIDLGTTNSLVGLIDTGFPVLIPMDEGKRLLPSCLHFPSADAEPMIGYAAKRARAGRPSETIYSVKRFVGRRHAELDEEDMVVTYPIEKDENGEIVIPIHGRTYNAVELSSLILKKLKAAAEKYLEAPVTKAVITVPAYFNDAQRAATKKAGELAGFQVERILNEPTAAAMAFGIDKKLKDARCAVYDLGGGTFDLSILELNEGVSRVLSTNGNTRLGGDDIDAVLTDEIARRLVTAARCHIDRALLARIHEIAEKVKCELSDAETSKVEIPFAKDDFHFETTITREELEFLAKPIIEKTRKHCMQALADAKLSPEEIDEVILVGGQTRMPLVREVVREIFKREPNTSVNPDEAVALGAAIQGGILSGAVQNMILLDVTPLSLGIETFGGLMNVIIGRNTTIPVKAGEQFTNAVANQSSMRIHILQGERELSRDNWSLGQFDLEFTPSPRGVARVGVQFEIDADGILNVLARDIATGAEKRVAIRSAVDVSDEQVEKMVAESVEFAFDDMRERQFIEAELKARRLMETTSKAVAMMAGKLSDDEERQVAELIEGIKISCESRDPLQVKVAMQNLDKGTAFLAQLLMDSAVDDALAKKMIST